MEGTYTITDLQAGMTAVFFHTITPESIDKFAEICGDQNPLHVNAQFAKSRGFANRVVHGAYFAGLVSRLVGMHLPGINCFLLDMKLNFVSPGFPNESVKVCGELESVHLEQKAVMIKFTITCESELKVRGKVMVGFTGKFDNEKQS